MFVNFKKLKEMLLMYLMYADESGNTGIDYDNKQQPIFVLGTFFIEDNNWHKINNYFNKRKIEICSYFKDNEIHTNEIFNPPHNSIFHIKDWKKNFQILDNLVDLILELDIQFQYIAIDKKMFKIAVQQRVGNFIKIEPYIYSFCMIYKFMSKSLQEKNEKGIIFLDEIVNIPQYLNKIYPEISINNNSIIEQALFLKSKDTNFIQIADIYAFYVCQYLNIIKKYKKYSDFKSNHCINAYNKLLSKTNMVNTEFLLKYFPSEYFK